MQVVVNHLYTTTTTKSLQSCLTLCDPIDGSPAGSPVPGILQARTLEWVAISFSNAWKWKVEVKSLSRVRLLGTPWTAAHQAPLPMGFSRWEYWSGVPLSSPITYIRWLKSKCKNSFKWCCQRCIPNKSTLLLFSSYLIFNVFYLLFTKINHLNFWFLKKGQKST